MGLTFGQRLRLPFAVAALVTAYGLAWPGYSGPQPPVPGYPPTGPGTPVLTPAGSLPASTGTVTTPSRGQGGGYALGGSGNFAAGNALRLPIPPECAVCVTFGTSYAGVTTVQGIYRMAATTGQARIGVAGGRPFYYRGPLYEAIQVSGADANISWELIPDGPYVPFESGTAKLGPEVSVPVGGSLDQAIIANGNGKVYVLSPGTTTISVLALKNAGVNPNAVTVRGGAPLGGLLNWYAGTLVAPNANDYILNFLDFNTAINQVTWTGCGFEYLAITSVATVSPFTHVCFWGRGNGDVTFTDVGVYDMQAMFARSFGPGLRFEGTFAHGATGLVTSLSQSVLTPTDLWVESYIGNFTATTGVFGVNAAGSDNTAAFTSGGTAAPFTGTAGYSVVATTTGVAITVTGGPEGTRTLVVAGSVTGGNTFTGTFAVTATNVYTITNVTTVNSLTVGASYSRWTFMSAKWAGAGAESLVDSEFAAAFRGPDLYFGYAYLIDTELCALVNVESVTVDTVYQRVTLHRSDIIPNSTCPLFRTFLTASAPANNPGFGVLEVGTAVVWQDDTAANGTSGAAVLTVTGSAVGLEQPFYFKRVHFGSLTMYLNGQALSAAGSTPPISIAINTTGTANATVADDISFDKVEWGFTSVPASPHSVFAFNCTGDGSHTYTFGNVWLGTAIALGVTAASWSRGFPATVNGGVLTVVARFGIAGQVNAATFGFGSLDLSRVSPTGTAPFIQTTAGTFTFTALSNGVTLTATQKLQAGWIAAVLQKSETGADANVLTTPTLAAGAYTVKIALDCSVWAANMTVTLTYDDSNGTEVSKALILQDLTTGADLTTIAETGNYGGDFPFSTDGTDVAVVAVTGAVGNTYKISVLVEQDQ